MTDTSKYDKLYKIALDLMLGELCDAYHRGVERDGMWHGYGSYDAVCLAIDCGYDPANPIPAQELQGAIEPTAKRLLDERLNK